MFSVANDTIYRGMSITSNSSSFFITDFGDGFVKQFDRFGAYKGAIGQGEGRGPGEFLNMTNMFASDDEIWISDVQALRITRFSLSSGEFDLYPLERRPMRVAANDSLVVIMWIMAESMFSLYDKSGNKLFDFEHPSIIPIDDQMAFDGWITLSDNHMLYIPRNYGAIFGFDLTTGKHDFTISTPDGGPLPASEQRAETGRLVTIAPNTRVRNTDIEYVRESGKLVVSVFDQGEPQADGSFDAENHTFWLDIYDIANPAYLYSFELPHIVSSFTFLDDYFLIYSSTSARGLSYIMDSSFRTLIFE